MSTKQVKECYFVILTQLFFSNVYVVESAVIEK